jgi:cytochrome c
MTKAKLVGLAAALIIGFSGAAMAAGDADAGKKVFKKCKACHTLKEGGKNRVGPNLWGILGRQAGTKEGFKFSKDMVAAGEAGLVWSEETLAAYLTKKDGTKVFVGSFIGKKKARTKMAFPGLKKEGQVADVVAYIGANTQ